MAFIDLRQFNVGHTLVIPRAHCNDIRDLEPESGAALMATVSRVTKAVAAAFPNQGISLWSSIGPAAFQEVPHLHIHVHPRLDDDQLLRIYPHAPRLPGRQELEALAATLRRHL